MIGSLIKWRANPREESAIPIGVYVRKRLPDVQRYLAKVDKSDPDGCWPWTGCKNRRGYGNFWDGTRYPSGRTRIVLAHRWGYERFIGPIPPGENVCHRCDNPPCQRPDHWFVGTQTDNMADRKAKGHYRPARGGAAHNSSLTDRQAAEIRARYGGTHGEKAALAREFSVNESTVARILSGERYVHGA